MHFNGLTFLAFVRAAFSKRFSALVSPSLILVT